MNNSKSFTLKSKHCLLYLNIFLKTYITLLHFFTFLCASLLTAPVVIYLFQSSSWYSLCKDTVLRTRLNEKIGKGRRKTILYIPQAMFHEVPSCRCKMMLSLPAFDIRWFIVPMPFVSMQAHFPTSQETPIPIAKCIENSWGLLAAVKYACVFFHRLFPFTVILSLSFFLCLFFSLDCCGIFFFPHFKFEFW